MSVEHCYSEAWDVAPRPTVCSVCGENLWTRDDARGEGATCAVYWNGLVNCRDEAARVDFAAHWSCATKWSAVIGADAVAAHALMESDRRHAVSEG